jgi:hypothetical protein
MDDDTRLPWEGDEERWKLYNGGVLWYPLWDLIPRWLRELANKGLTGSKERSPVDVPQEPGGVVEEASDGRRVWIRPDAYRDEDGHSRAEVRELYSRTDGAIWATLAVLEGGEGGTLKGALDERRLREDYDAWRPLRVEQKPVSLANERLLEFATVAAQHFYPHLDELPTDFDELPEHRRGEIRRELELQRREIVLGFARRIHTIAKAVRGFQEYGERGLVGHTGDPGQDVLAAELRDLKGWPWVKVGQHLGFPQTDTDKVKNDNQRARKAAMRGRNLLNQASSG